MDFWGPIHMGGNIAGVGELRMGILVGLAKSTEHPSIGLGVWVALMACLCSFWIRSFLISGLYACEHYRFLQVTPKPDLVVITIDLEHEKIAQQAGN